jgi:ketosteroid isomerase-like protein
MPTRERVEQLIALVEQGRFVEAIEAFYTEDASMQENLQPPRKGRDALVAGERKVLAAFKQVRTLPVEAFLVDGDRVVINWVFEFSRHDGRSFRQDELAWQRWRGDRIVEERFYYDPAQQRPAAG